MQSGRSAAPVVAIAGATGAVGIELLGCLERRNFPVSELRLFASARSAGKTLPFRGKPVPVQELTDEGLNVRWLTDADPAALRNLNSPGDIPD